MTWVATAIIGSSLIGAYSSNKASGQQADAANNAAQLQKDQFDKTVELQEPFRQAGMAGQNRLMDYLGLNEDTGQQGFGTEGADHQGCRFFFQDDLFHSQQGFRNRHPGRSIPNVDGFGLKGPFFTSHHDPARGVDFIQ